MLNIEIYIDNGTTTSTTADTADANGDFSTNVSFFAGTNYITVSQETGGGTVKVMSPASLSTRLQQSPLRGAVILID